jgi:hypothetical protein
MAKITKLNSSAILQGHSKQFIQEELTITINGKDYKVLIDQKFRPTKLNELILELLNNFENINKLNEAVKISYFMFLVIKYFSDVDVAKCEKFEDQIRVLNAMLDLEIFDKIINAFPEDELKKVNEYMIKFGERMDEFLKDNKNIEELKDIIEKEIKQEGDDVGFSPESISTDREETSKTD